MAATATSCSPRYVAPLLKLVASSSSSTARPRRPLVQQLQLPRLRATAAVAAAPLALAPPPLSLQSQIVAAFVLSFFLWLFPLPKPHHSDL